MKQWLFSFDVEPSPAALPVVIVHLDERMRRQHVIGHQRGGTVRIGGRGGLTVADGDRIQRASISSARGCHSDKTVCMSSIARRPRRSAPAGAAK